MRNAIEIIHGAIKWIDDPLVVAGLITYDSFFAVKRVFWKFFEKQLGNQFLCLNIDLQLDIVRCDSIHSLRPCKIFAKQLSGCARGLFGRIEIMLHREVDPLNG
jgi:hypothetical protein